MMTSKSLIVKGVFVGFVCASMLYWAACGASRQRAEVKGDEVDIDQLLGEEEANTLDRASEEAEILKLLGITHEEGQTEESQAEETPITAVDQEPQPAQLSTEIDQLQKELEQKDQEISKLRSELTEKETKLSDLQSRLETRRSATVSASRLPKGTASEAFKLRYQEALNLFNSRNYQEALRVFSELLESDPNNSLSDNCQYWIGECYYGLGNYNQAIVEFEKVFSFPNSNKNDDAQLKLGISYLKLGDRQQARTEFEHLLSNYPDSEYVELARRYLARL